LQKELQDEGHADSSIIHTPDSSSSGRIIDTNSQHSLHRTFSVWGLVNVKKQARPPQEEKTGNDNKSSSTTGRCRISGQEQPIKVGATPVCGGCPFGLTRTCDIANKQQQQLSW
jgi:hypothetical protein